MLSLSQRNCLSIDYLLAALSPQIAMRFRHVTLHPPSGNPYAQSHFKTITDYRLSRYVTFTYDTSVQELAEMTDRTSSSPLNIHHYKQQRTKQRRTGAAAKYPSRVYIISEVHRTLIGAFDLSVNIRRTLTHGWVNQCIYQWACPTLHFHYPNHYQ